MSVLLQQMESMLQLWDRLEPDATATSSLDPMARLAPDFHRVEMCRSALALFANGSGPYRPLLQKLFRFLFDLLDRLITMAQQQDVGLLTGGGGNNNRSLTVHKSTAAAAAGGGLVAHASGGGDSPAAFGLEEETYAAIRKQQEKVSKVVHDADEQRTQYEQVIRQLQETNTKLEGLLAHHMMRAQKGVVEADKKKVVQWADDERTNDELRQSLMDATEELSEHRLLSKELKSLNARYAAQSLELTARMHVLLDKNSHMSTTLTIQMHDLMTAEKEAETLRYQMNDMKRVNRLLSEAVEKRDEKERPGVTVVGLGTNRGVPKQLQHSGFVRHVLMSRRVAQHLVHDILQGRKGKSASLQVFTNGVLSRRYGNDALAYAYALDAACETNFDQLDLLIFGNVSRFRLSESIYTLVPQEVELFLDCCRLCDVKLHGSETLSIPFVYVFGILADMYPSYSPSMMERLFAALSDSKTNAGAIFYGTLFPDVDRELLLGVDADQEYMEETGFSGLFKILMVQDALFTLQLTEDYLLDFENDSATVDEIIEYCQRVKWRFGLPLHHLMEGVLDLISEGKTHLPIRTVIAAMRTTTVLRSGMWQPRDQSGSSFSGRGHEALVNKAMRDWSALTGDVMPQVDTVDMIAKATDRRMGAGLGRASRNGAR